MRRELYAACEVSHYPGPQSSISDGYAANAPMPSIRGARVRITMEEKQEAELCLIKESMRDLTCVALMVALTRWIRGTNHEHPLSSAI